MAIEFPAGAVIGVIGPRNSGASELLRAIGSTEEGTRRYLGPTDSLDLTPVDVLIIDHSLAQLDALEREQAAIAIHKLRVNGSTVFVASHQADLLRSISDEIWWFEAGRLVQRGDPAEVLDAYRRRVLEQFRAWGETQSSLLRPALRKGDGRGEIVAIETVGASGQPAMIWQSGEPVTVRVTMLYRERVENPVIGIMIRTRIGFAVYGTNTELEKVNVGPCDAGETVTAEFEFHCDLCPGDYTLTAASHDPDGTAHDWMDDAVAFLVADTRYTAGVANLRASVRVERANHIL